ncbi:MAG: lysylphosphatidylglycerol synthase domain-containing protein [Nannocystaceae bacterium]
MTPPEPRGRPRLAALWIVLKIALFAALIVGIAGLVDRDELMALARRLPATSLVGFVVCMSASFAVMVLRWTIIARGQLGLARARFGYLLRTAMLAEFASIWLPTFIAGEGVRLVRVAAITDAQRYPEAAASVVLDRLSGVLALFALCVPCLPVLLDYRDRVPFSPWLGALALCVAIAAMLAAPALLRRYSGTVRSIRAATRLLRSAPLFSLPLALSFVTLALIVVAYALLLAGLADLSLTELGLLSLGARVGRFVPVSLFGVGGVEGGTYLIGELLGLGSEVIVVILAVNVAFKYLLAAVGALLELYANGRAFMAGLSRRSADAVRQAPTRARTGDPSTAASAPPAPGDRPAPPPR